MHDDCKLPRTCLQATLQSVYKLPCTGSVSLLARCLQATLHGVYKQPCTMAASCLARGLQATLHGVCKPACRGCARKGAFPEAVVGANDYSPLREGYVHLIYTRPLVSMRTSLLSACAQAPCQHAHRHLVSMRTSTLSACAQAPCPFARGLQAIGKGVFT